MAVTEHTLLTATLPCPLLLCSRSALRTGSCHRSLLWWFFLTWPSMLRPSHSALRYSVFLQCPVMFLPGSDCIFCYICICLVICLLFLSYTRCQALCRQNCVCFLLVIFPAATTGLSIWSVLVDFCWMSGWMHECMDGSSCFREQVWWCVCLKCMGLITIFISQLCNFEQVGQALCVSGNGKKNHDRMILRNKIIQQNHFTKCLVYTKLSNGN